MGGIVFTWLAILLALMLAAGISAIWTWQGRWRWLALASLLPPLFVAGRIFVDVAADPTSHNLWPLEMLGALTVSLAVLGGIQLVRLTIGRVSQ
jgi:hypothetical protein